MDHERITIEEFISNFLPDWANRLKPKPDDSIWWKCVIIISNLFIYLAWLLYLILYPFLVGIRLAVRHADRSVFVLASALLTFYQVPRKVFYIYMAVLAGTGFYQSLTYPTDLRTFVLYVSSSITCGISDRFLRKFTTFHFSNPFNRCLIRSKVIYVPIGLEIPRTGISSTIEVFDFPVSADLNFEEVVGNCRIKIGTLATISGSSTISDVYVEAPWGKSRFTVIMENKNLGRFISYFKRVSETDCKELICTPVSGRFMALGILEVVKHFNSELPLAKVEACSPGTHHIV